MSSLQGSTAAAAAMEMAAKSPVLAGFHTAPSSTPSFAQSSRSLVFSHGNVPRISAAPKPSVAAGAYFINNFHGGICSGREGLRNFFGSRFAVASTAERGQFGFLMGMVKKSSVCGQCRKISLGGSFACLSSTTTSYGGGGGRGIGGAGGGGGGGGDGFEVRASGNAAAVGGEQSEDLPVGSSGEDVITLDVGGMSCGGCSASVKRILESQPQVCLANVILESETAFVQISFDDQAQADRATLKQEIGELLAKHLTSCGFKSSVREVL